MSIRDTGQIVFKLDITCLPKKQTVALKQFYSALQLLTVKYTILMYYFEIQSLIVSKSPNMNSSHMTNTLLNRFRRSMRVRDGFMQAITPLSFYSKTLRRTTTCTSIQYTGSLHRWTSILQTGGGCVYRFLMKSDVKFPSSFYLAARVLTKKLIKVSEP